MTPQSAEESASVTRNNGDSGRENNMTKEQQMSGSSRAAEGGGASVADQQETERRLLAESDFLFNLDEWECTHNDFGTLADEGDLSCRYGGEITTIGRLKTLAHAYAVNVPVSWHEGEPDDWEVKLYPTREAAVSAFKTATAPQAAPVQEEP